MSEPWDKTDDLLNPDMQEENLDEEGADWEDFHEIHGDE